MEMSKHDRDFESKVAIRLRKQIAFCGPIPPDDELIAMNKGTLNLAIVRLSVAWSNLINSLKQAFILGD